MTNLIAATAFFLLLHLVVSGSRMRDVLVARLGSGAYLGLFSLASVAGLAWLIWGYGQARAAPTEVWWTVGPATRHTQLIFQLLAMLLVVPGLTTRNPTSVAQEGALNRPDAVSGMLRITRHPFLWGVAIWAIGHLLVNGDAHSVLLFGQMLFLALVGTLMIDAKRRRALGPAWDAFAAQTSNVPFAAILSGRQRLSLKEIGAWRIALAIALWALVAWAHPWMFGVRALP